MSGGCSCSTGGRGEAHQPPDLSMFTDRLRRGERRVTGPRQVILEHLRRHSHPLTPREIHTSTGQRCDLATVYRSLRMLEDLGLVKRYEFGDGVSRYELVGEDRQSHHHHLVCTGCSRVVELDECHAVDWERRVAAANGFSSVTHRLEFFGVCPRCQPAGGR